MCDRFGWGIFLEVPVPIQVGDYGLLKTGLQPINYKHMENLQAFIVNPYWVIFQQMTLLLIATVLMMAMIVYCLVYQIRIAHQNKIARMRERFLIRHDS